MSTWTKDKPTPGEWWLSLAPSKRHHSRPAVMRVCITPDDDIILREGGTLCYVGWPKSVLEGAQWRRAELVPADPFAEPPLSYSQDNDLP